MDMIDFSLMADIRTTGPVSLRSIFLAFLKMGTFAFGGVYSMMSFFERELVQKRKWITHDEYIESVAIGQMTPGPPIINTGICIGYRLRKIAGALTATLGQIFTGTVIAILLAALYMKAEHYPFIKPIMKGIGASVIGLLLSIIIKMSGRSIRDLKTAAIAISAFVCLAVFRLNPILIILASAIAGLLLFRKRCS